LRAKTAVEYQTIHRGDCSANQRWVDLHGKFDFLAGSLGQRGDEAHALFIAQRVRASYFCANAAGCLICEAIEFIVDEIERDQASLVDQKSEEVSNRLTSLPLLADALQHLSPLANGVQRLEEPPPKIGIRGEQPGHVIELLANRRDITFLLRQREKSARIALSGFALHD
jgi:hypothetical protein